jgi:hypothetical protein
MLFQLIADFINFIFSIMFYPLKLVFSFVYLLFSIFFVIQNIIANTCYAIIGDIWICHIIDPDFVFTHLFFDIVLYSVIAYGILYIYTITQQQ